MKRFRTLTRLSPAPILLILLTVATTGAFVLPAIAEEPAEKPNSATEALHQLFDDEWEWQLEQFPMMATMTGDPRYGDQITDMSLDAIEARKAHSKDVERRLLAIDRSALSQDDQLNYDLYLRNVRQSLEGQRFRARPCRSTRWAVCTPRRHSWLA